VGEITIDRIVRSKRRTIGLEIGADASLTVRAPVNAPLSAIERVINEKRAWIVKKQRLVRERAAAVPARRFVTGEEFLVLGTPYPLVVTEKARVRFALSDSRFVLKSSATPRARRLFLLWYRRKAAEVIGARVAFYAQRHGLSYSAVRISGARRRWGSASTRGSLNFSWRLVMAPITVIDYVVVHELAHLSVPNHSPRFWALVASLYPNYKKARRWLKDNGHLLTLGPEDTAAEADSL
jgi:predicted metal-dependent hydrolase